MSAENTAVWRTYGETKADAQHHVRELRRALEVNRLPHKIYRTVTGLWRAVVTLPARQWSHMRSLGWAGPYEEDW